ncbi:MAG: hypothetical protein AB7F97_10415 [Solirubrobacterales bacterium]
MLLATVAALALLVSACGGGSDSGSSEDPQKVIDQATLEGVESGNLDLSLKVNAEGDEGGNLDLSLSGPFQAGPKGELPEADLEVSAHGEAEGEQLDFEGGATLLSDRAYIGYEGEEYEVDPTTFGFVKSGFEQAQQESGGEAAGGKACQEAAAELEIGDFIDNLVNEGGVDVDGTATTEISGDLNLPGAIDQIIKLTENPACSSQLEMAGPLPLGELEKAKDELGKAVKKAHVAVFVGEDDQIVRKVETQATLQPEEGGKVELDFELTLGEVNEEQSISAPSGAKPLEQLFDKLGVNPLELLQGGGIEGLLEGATGDSSSGGESPSEIELPDPEESEAYLECLEELRSASDLQKCANLAPK